MLDTTFLEVAYETTMKLWLQVQDTDMCDLCRSPSATGVLYNIPGEGKELLVCYSCYTNLLRNDWRES